MEYILQHTETFLLTLTLISAVTFITSLLLIPWFVANLPYDYFQQQKHRPTQRTPASRLLHWVFIIGKNIIGVCLLLAGVLMLVLPGQGLLTMVMGILLLDFPYKYRFERWMITYQPLLKSINWLRKKTGQRPLEL